MKLFKAEDFLDAHKAKLVCLEKIPSHTTRPIEPNLDDVCDHGLMKTTFCRLCDEGDL